MNLEQLCSKYEAQTGRSIRPRTVRHYVQRGAIDPPAGVARGARYGEHHLEQLRRVDELKAQGLSLNAIVELLQEGSFEPNPIPLRAAYYGVPEVWTRVHVADGLEFQIDASRADLTTEEVEALITHVQRFLATRHEPSASTPRASGQPTPSAAKKAAKRETTSPPPRSSGQRATVTGPARSRRSDTPESTE